MYPVEHLLCFDVSLVSWRSHKDFMLFSIRQKKEKNSLMRQTRQVRKFPVTSTTSSLWKQNRAVYEQIPFWYQKGSPYVFSGVLVKQMILSIFFLRGIIRVGCGKSKFIRVRCGKSEFIQSNTLLDEVTTFLR